MSTRTRTIAIATAAVLLSAPAAFAGEMEDKSETVKAETTESRTVTLRNEVMAEVRGAVASGEYTAVEGPDGKIYYNRIIPISELPDPTLEIEEAETYTFEYRGMTFTNKVVQDIG